MGEKEKKLKINDDITGTPDRIMVNRHNIRQTDYFNLQKGLIN